MLFNPLKSNRSSGLHYVSSQLKPSISTTKSGKFHPFHRPPATLNTKDCGFGGGAMDAWKSMETMTVITQPRVGELSTGTYNIYRYLVGGDWNLTFIFP